MKVFKVVTKREDGKLYSRLEHDQYDIEYKIGEISYPKIGYLYAFKDMFINKGMLLYDSDCLYEAEAEVLIDVWPEYGVTHIEETWNNFVPQTMKEKEGELHSYKGNTIMCKNITLLKEILPNDIIIQKYEDEGGEVEVIIKKYGNPVFEYTFTDLSKGIAIDYVWDGIDMDLSRVVKTYSVDAGEYFL